MRGTYKIMQKIIDFLDELGLRGTDSIHMENIECSTIKDKCYLDNRMHLPPSKISLKQYCKLVDALRTNAPNQQESNLNTLVVMVLISDMYLNHNNMVHADLEQKNGNEMETSDYGSMYQSSITGSIMSIESGFFESPPKVPNKEMPKKITELPLEEIYSPPVNEPTWSTQEDTEEPNIDNKFDWTDQTRKKEDKAREKHAKYFSPLSAYCELIAEPQEQEVREKKKVIEKPVTKEDVAKEWQRVRLREREKILEKRRKQNEKQDQKKKHGGKMDKIQVHMKNSRITDHAKEKQINQQRIESHQEDIIEKEEDVPAFKNMPKQEYQKEQKTRRRQIAAIPGQTIVHCPCCNHKRRSVADIIKHIHQIHNKELKEHLNETENVHVQPPTENNEIEGNRTEKKMLQIDIICSLDDDGNNHAKLEFNKSIINSNDQVENSIKQKCFQNKEAKMDPYKDDDNRAHSEQNLQLHDINRNISISEFNDDISHVPSSPRNQQIGPFSNVDDSNLKDRISVDIQKHEGKKLSVTGKSVQMLSPSLAQFSPKQRSNSEKESSSTWVTMDAESNFDYDNSDDITSQRTAQIGPYSKNINLEISTLSEYNSIETKETMLKVGLEKNKPSVKRDPVLMMPPNAARSKIKVSWVQNIATKFTNKLRMIKGGVRKKDYIRRTTEKLAAPSPAISKAFLLRLKNDGNFCYSNAVVTCLLGNPLVQQFCLEENGFPGGPLSLLKTLLRTSINQVGCTSALRQWITKQNPGQGTNFVANRQQDTADFLASLLLSIENELTQDKKIFLWNLFGSTLIEEFDCDSSILSNCIKTISPPLVYPYLLPVPASNSKSLEESLELLCRKNQVRVRVCPDVDCNGQFALSNTKFGKLPKVLILQLQRFDSHNNREFKLDHDIDIPIQYQPVTEGPQYILTGAVVHYGNTTSSGHFVSIVRCPDSGNLFRCNDSLLPVAISNENEAKILKKAYMVVYSEKNETLQSLDHENLSPVKKKMRTAANDGQRDTALNIEEATGNSIDNGISTDQETGEDIELSLPTPQYTSCLPGNKGSSTHNPEKMTRSELLEYCATYLPTESTVQNTERLRFAVFSSLFERHTKTLTNEDITSILVGLNMPPNKNKPKRKKQLFQVFKDNDNKFEFLDHLKKKESNQQPDDDSVAMTGDLPTPPYTTLYKPFSNEGPVDQVTEKETISEEQCPVQEDNHSQESTMQTDVDIETRHFPDYSNMSRQLLLDYCRVNLPTVIPNNSTEQLRASVFKNVFSSLIEKLGFEQLEELLKKYGIKPNTHKLRRKGQLLHYFERNKSDKNDIIDYLRETSCNQVIDDAVCTSSYKNDFFPSNMEKIMENKSELKAIRQERVNNLQNGTFKLTSEIQPNPIFEAGREMCKELQAITWGECNTCKERWLGMETGPRSKKCSRCAKERLPAGIPPTFSPDNDMDPGPQPECLRILNTVETAAISLICPTLCIYKLRGGGSGLKGHSVSFHQNVQQFINTLPRRPEDLPYIVIKAPNQSMPLTANRHHIYDAIVFLKRNNPDYANIRIDMDSINLYPEDSSSPVQNIPTCDSEPCLSDVNVQPANVENTFDVDSHADLDTDEMVETVAPCEVPTSAMHDQIRKVIITDQQQPNQQQTTLDWPPRDNQPASEWEPGFFSKSFPNLFPYGSADITKPRIGKNPEFLAYIRHLTRLPDNRFASDQRFLLHVMSMYRRHKALTLGNVYASNVCKNMSMTELKAKVAEDNDTIMKSLVLFSSQIPGTKGYFSQESKKAIAMEKWIRIMSGGDEMLNVFLTFSLPDIHIEELHSLLPNSDQYLKKIVVPKLSDVPPDADRSLYIDEKTDFLLRSRALSQNGHIVHWFAQKKLSLLVEKVLHNTLGIVDYVIRSEYQSRSAVHWHMAGRMLGLSMLDIKKACKKYDFDMKDSTDEEMTEEEIEQKRREFLKEGVITDHPNTETFKQEVQESRDKVIDFTVLDLGLSACHPQIDPKLWPLPEGQNASKPATNCLRTNFLEVEDIDQDYEMLVNRVERHTCRLLYCLKKILDRYRCRFGFPLTLIGFIVKILDEEGGSQIWDEVVRSEDFPSGAGFDYGKLQILRNHPKIVMHVPELLEIWRGNIDQKLIECPKTFLKYALKYMLKPEAGSLAFTDIIKTLTMNADDSAPVRKVFQKILLKTVGEHDMSKNEAWRIVSGEPYVTYSRPFRFLNLTGSRRVNIEANENADQPAVAKNYCDIYWAKESDENYLNFVEKYESEQIAYPLHPKDVSLYDFASCFTNKWHPSHKMYVPKPTPCFTYVPIPENEEYRKAYCETTLLLHKPGSTPNNLLDKHEDVEKAMLDFASNDDLCPKVIKEEYLASIRMTAAELANIHNNVEDLVPSEGSQTVNLEQEDWMIGLGDVVRQTDIMDPEPDTVDDEEDFMDIDMDENVDWSSDRVALNLSNQQVDDATDWIARMKVSADLDLDPHAIEDVPPESLNDDQRPIYEVMMNALADNQPQKLIDVSGGAGTGKSYLIKAILQKAQENSGHRNLVRIVSPTGSAASHFPDGQTIHSLLKIPVKKGCGELDDLSGGPLAALQESFRHTRAIIIDEKGMVGLGRLSQINARLKQAKPEAAELPFGGITILLAGDLRQLQPVGDFSLYTQKGGDLIHQQGRVLYRLFDAETFCLHQQMRQQGEENQEFREQLERLATGKFTVSDWENWSKHDITKLEEEEKNMFIGEATMLCAKKKDMSSFNLYHLKRTGHPVARLKALNSSGASAFATDQAQGLRNITYLSKDAKIVLTSNLWAAAKLVNGSQGTVKYLIYKEGECPSKNLPDLVICHFPGYIGPSFVQGQEKLVPLAPQRATWFAKNLEYSRTQFPLILSWALTIHKAQGMTLGKIIINLSETEFASGLTYTAVTRVRRAADMAFSPFPNYIRLAKIFRSKAFKERIAEEARKLSLCENRDN